MLYHWIGTISGALLPLIPLLLARDLVSLRTSFGSFAMRHCSQPVAGTRSQLFYPNLNCSLAPHAIATHENLKCTCQTDQT
jgi:hypothetical protein